MVLACDNIELAWAAGGNALRRRAMTESIFSAWIGNLSGVDGRGVGGMKNERKRRLGARQTAEEKRQTDGVRHGAGSIFRQDVNRLAWHRSVAERVALAAVRMDVVS